MKIIDAVWCEYDGKTMPIVEAEKLQKEKKPVTKKRASDASKKSKVD